MKPAMPAFFMMEFEIGYWGLFITSFLAATFIPITSELFLISMLIMGYHPLSCLFFATVGNSIGGWFNYLLGQIGDPKWLKKIRYKLKLNSLLQFSKMKNETGPKKQKSKNEISNVTKSSKTARRKRT